MTAEDHIKQLRAAIWAAAGQDKARVDKAKAACSPEQDSPQWWHRVLTHIQLHPPRKKKVDRETLTPSQRQRFIKAYHDWQAREHPVWVESGHTMDPIIPSVGTDKGLKEFIRDFLLWSGHFANITDNKGTKHVTTAPKADLNGNIHQVVTGAKWHRSTMANGTQDIDANLKHPDHPYGIPWKIEAKTSGDRSRKHQEKFGKVVKSTGGVYSEVRGVEDFFLQYDRLMIRQGSLSLK